MRKSLRSLSFSLVIALAGCGDDSGSSVTPDMSMPTGQNDCPPPSGPGVQHSGILTTSDTWTAADSPHVITSSTQIRGGATITLEPCAVVRVQKGYTIAVGAANAADGT